MVWMEKSSLLWAVPGELSVLPALQTQVTETGTDLLPFVCSYIVEKALCLLFYQLLNNNFVVRWQSHVWRVRNTVQTQQRVWVFHGVSKWYGDHWTDCPSLKSATVKFIFLHIFQAHTTLSGSQPRIHHFLAQWRDRYSCTVKRTHTVTLSWCWSCKLQVSFQNEIRQMKKCHWSWCLDKIKIKIIGGIFI